MQAKTREIATIAERGNDKVWGKTVGGNIVMWVPMDGNAISRCCTSLLRRGPDSRPSSIRLVAQIPLLPGMQSVEKVTDLWWNALVGDKWASLVNGHTFSTHPYEMVLPGPNGPRLTRAGLAVLNIAHEGPRHIPRMLVLKEPLMTIDDTMGMVADMVTDSLPSFMLAMQDKNLINVVCRQPRRSMACTDEAQRVCVDLLFPKEFARLDQLLFLRHPRRVILLASTFYGSKDMFSVADAMILEVSNPMCVHHSWPLCTEIVALSADKFLIYSEVASETWTERLDFVLGQDARVAAIKLKWKPSK